jgi:hypothetical protein
VVKTKLETTMFSNLKKWLSKTERCEPRNSTRLGVEALGDRTLMSATVSNGLLTITGSNTHDAVEVRNHSLDGVTYVMVSEQRVTNPGTVFETRSTPQVSWFAASAVNRIRFNGLEGADRFTNNTAIGTTAYGGIGNDTLRGGSGADYLYGGGDYDTLFGNGGTDRLYGEGSIDRLQGGTGTDYLYGGAGNDKLFGGSGYDYLYGQADNDFLDGGNEANTLSDPYGSNFNARRVAINGATKRDIIQFSSPTCGCLAGIIAVSHRSNLANLIRYRGVGDDGVSPVYDVSLFIGGRWQTYAVSFNGDIVTNGANIYDPDAVEEYSADGCKAQSWVIILQRAYLQSQGVNWQNWMDVESNGRCNAGNVMTALTGVASSGTYDGGWPETELDRDDRLRIQAALTAGKSIVAGTQDDRSDLTDSRLVQDHAYAVLSWRTDAAGHTVLRVRNPWGVEYNADRTVKTPAEIEILWEHFKGSFTHYWING